MKENHQGRFHASRVQTAPCEKARFTRGGGTDIYGYVGMCRCEGYGFQAVYSRIGYINQSVWV